MKKGGEVWEGTWMKWVWFEASVIFAVPCDGAGGEARSNGDHWKKASCWPPLLWSSFTFVPFSKSDCFADFPKIAMHVSVLLKCVGSLVNKSFCGGVFALAQGALLLSVDGSTDPLSKARPFELVGGGRIGVLPLPLRFNSLLSHGRELHPAF